MSPSTVVAGSSLVVIGDRVTPQPHLASLVGLIRRENEALPADKQVQYVICDDYSTLAVALKKFRSRISLILVGPGLNGKQDMIVRLIGRDIKSVLALGPGMSLSDSPEQNKRLLANLVELGVSVVVSGDASEEFWEPIVKEQVVAGLSADLDLASMTAEQRAEQLDKRLESVTMFPSLPETQNRVSALDDLDHPKKWAAAIDQDVPIKTVILNLLNSAHYSFRTRITTIEQAVSLASARTIREVVLACTVQRLFRNVEEARIDQFWRHSVATGFFAKMLALPAVPEEQTPQEKTEFARLQLEDEAKAALREARLWSKFELGKDADAFTAGLLHDIGKVTIALCFEDALRLVDPVVSTGVREADAEGRIWAESSRQVERQLMGDIDHQTVGGRIARRWGLTPEMQEVITQHHLVRRTSAPLTRLVALANLAANTLHSYPFQEEQHALSRLMGSMSEALQADERDEAEAWPDHFALHVEPRLPQILEEYEVPDNLWKTVPAVDFFRLVWLLRPRVKRLTGTFLQMTAQVA